MKKAYSKPEIVFENFSLSTNIAAGCEQKNELQSGGTCGHKWGKSTIFTEEVTGCKKKVTDGSGDYNGLCYHVPNESYNVFNS